MEYAIIASVIVGVLTGILIGSKMVSKSSKAEVKEKDEKIIKLSMKVAETEQKVKDLENMKDKVKTEFENIANTILKSSREDLSEANKEKLDDILKPLKEKMDDFKQAVQDTYVKGAKARASLKTEIKNLMNFSKQVSDDANNLAKALKGEVKIQGNWGEMQLKILLEKVGLKEGVHFKMQESFKDEEGKTKYPDCVLYLPEARNLIIDSKVSLVAYERFFNAIDDEERAKAAKEHLVSIEKHIKELSEKKYEDLYSINTPDYVFMFVPLEGAVALAQNEKSELFESAMDKNIVIVSASALLATLMTVAFIWKQESQKKYAREIARQGGALYDKFVGFVENMQDIGNRLKQASDSYEGAMNKLSTGQGNLVSSAEKIRKLGVKAQKNLPKEIVDIAKADNGAKKRGRQKLRSKNKKQAGQTDKPGRKPGKPQTGDGA
jgi:DNA recombination protein RmuC